MIQQHLPNKYKKIKILIYFMLATADKLKTADKLTKANKIPKNNIIWKYSNPKKSQTLA